MACQRVKALKTAGGCSLASVRMAVVRCAGHAKTWRYADFRQNKNSIFAEDDQL
jgi:hypothetical protein